MGFTRSQASYSSETGGLEIEPNDETAQLISFDESIKGSISSSSDLDFYSVEAPGAGSLTLTMTTEGISQFSSQEFVYYIYDSANNILASESCTTACTTLTVALPASGGYGIGVQSSSTFSAPDGFYTLTASYSSETGGLEIEPNDETAQLISFDESIKGSISSSSDLDFYSVEAPGAGSLTLTMTTEGISQFSSQEFVYYIYDSANNILASESCTTACTTLTVALPASGGYGIGVQSSSTFSAPDGFYTLTASYSSETGGLEIEPNDETAQLISFDESIKGSISSSSDLDFYSVEAPGAGSLTLTMTTEGISQFSSQEFVYYIYDSANNILASESCTTACTTLTVALPASGGYGIGVQSSSTFSAPDGFYTLTASYSSETGGLEIEPNDETAQLISFDESIKGSISSSSDLDFYSVEAPGAGSLTLTMTTEGISQFSSQEFVYYIYDSANNILASESCTTACTTLTVALPASGGYGIGVQSSSTFSAPDGFYTLTASYSSETGGLEIEPNDETAQLISFDESIKGSISSSSDLDFYSVEAPGAGSLTLTMTTEGISQLMRPTAYAYGVFDSDGNLLARQYCTTRCSSLVVGIASQGTYAVAVISDSNYGAPDGFYRLMVSYSSETGGLELEPNNEAESANALFAGSNQIGSISTIDDIDWYSVAVSEVPGNLSISIGSTEVSNEGFLLQLLDDEKIILASLECSGSDCEAQPQLLVYNILGLGVYYLTIQSLSDTYAPLGEYSLKR